MKLACVIALCATLLRAAEPKLAFEWSRLPSLPDTNGVAGTFAGLSGGALLVAGGANFPEAKPWDGGKKVWHDTMFVLPKPDGAWLAAGRLARPLGYGVSVTHRDEVICAGGSDNKQHHRDVFALSWNSRRISTRKLPSLPKTIANACGAIVGETFYLAGGMEKPDATNALATFFALNLNEPGAKWRELPTWPGAPRMLATAAVQDDGFFLIGGVELHADNSGKPVRRYLRDAFRFEAAKGWRRMADLPFPCAAAPSPTPIVENQILILSCDNGSRASLAPSPEHPGFNATVLAYDIQRDEWRRVGTSPAPRVTAPLVRWKSHWIIPSGEVRPGIRSPEVWSVNVAPK